MDSQALTTKMDSERYSRQRKDWIKIGEFTREGAIECLNKCNVALKRRVPLLKSNLRRNFYNCKQRRATDCRYEVVITICAEDENKKVTIEHFGDHIGQCGASKRCTSKHQLSDFGPPVWKTNEEDEEPQPASSKLNRRKSSSDALELIKRVMSKKTKEKADDDEEEEDEIAEEDDVMEGDEADDLVDAKPSTDDSVSSSSHPASALTDIYQPDSPPQPSPIFANNIAIPRTPVRKEQAPSVWGTVDVDVLDMTKRPDGPFHFILHAIDQFSRFSFAYPMVSNGPEVVAEALLNMLYLFRAPDIVQLDNSYNGTPLPQIVQSKFSELTVRYFAQKRNNQGILLPRREAVIYRERVFAYLMENNARSWVKQLGELKHQHNSEWVDEIEATPFDVFFSRGNAEATINTTQSSYQPGDSINYQSFDASNLMSPALFANVKNDQN